ncbi:MAG: hypothetical protein QM778_28475 [Myxococcales bacterium]
MGIVMVALLAGGCSRDEEGPATQDCKRGTVGCGCAEGGQCGEGLACEQNLCTGMGSIELTVDPRARGCELLFDGSSAPVVGVDFSQGVKGVFVTEDPRTAVTFIAGEDAPIKDGSVRVNYADHGKGAPPISVTYCTDTKGAGIDGAKVSHDG